MIYKLIIRRKAQKQLSKLPPREYKKVKTKIYELAENPRPFGSKQLKDRNGTRIRVGNYRVIYDIFDDTLTILVISIGHRKKVYIK